MISVAMTTYNGEKYILDQLTSIVHQTLPVDEIILCDDVSSDSTAAVVEKFIRETRCHATIRFIRNRENLGYAENFRKAISQTRGDYIFLCDQDDLWEAAKVETMIRTMENSNAEFLCSGYSLIDGEGDKLRKAVAIPAFVRKAKPGLNPVRFFPLLFGNIAQGCTYCFTRRIKELYLNIDHRGLIHDYQLILIGAISGKCFFLNEKLIQYRIHEKNSVGLPPEKAVKKIRFHKHYYVPKLALFLRKVHPVLRVPHYYSVMAMIYLKIPVLYLTLRSYVSALRKKK